MGLALGIMGLWTGAAVAQTKADAAPAVAAKPLRIEDFTRDPDMSPPQLSPDGKRVAWVRRHEIFVYNRETESEKTLPSPNVPLRDVRWVNNDYFIVDLRDDVEHIGSTVTVSDYSPMVMTKDGTFVRVLFERDGKPVDRADLKPIIRIVDAPAPYVITMGTNNPYLTDIATGKFSIGPRMMNGYAHYFDTHGNERLAQEVLDVKPDYGALSMVIHYRAEANGKVADLKLAKQDHVVYLSLDYAEAENAFYWTQFDDAKGEATIWRFDMATGAKTLFKTSDNRWARVLIDKSGRVAGIQTLADRVDTEWTDPFRLKLVDAVQKLFPKATVSVSDMTDDAKTVVFLISAPDAPDAYYLYNADSKSLDEIGSNYPELEDKPLGEMTYITYKARDGMEIPAYVTKRKDTPANAPLVVLPHGGPAWRDVYGFDYMAQYLASKGYVVLQPQYRGSGGFGEAYQKAGDKHLAQMTTDLEDGVKYLAAQGTIDPAKVCIFGWSWGGYLAQAALAFTPKTYICGVSGDGVADLYEMLDESNDFFWGGYSSDYWRSVVGQPLLDAAMIHATSPIEHVDAIRAPLLLIHGTYDRTVNIHQSQHMNAAMQKAGKPVTYLQIDYMPHGPVTAAERLKVMTTVGDFIADAFAKAGTTAPAPAATAAPTAAPSAAK